MHLHTPGKARLVMLRVSQSLDGFKGYLYVFWEITELTSGQLSDKGTLAYFG